MRVEDVTQCYMALRQLDGRTPTGGKFIVLDLSTNYAVQAVLKQVVARRYTYSSTPSTDQWCSRDMEVKGKERKSIYIAPFCTKVHTKRSGMDNTVLPADNTMPAFPSWRSPDVTTTATEAADIQLQLTTHLSTPKG